MPLNKESDQWEDYLLELKKIDDFPEQLLKKVITVGDIDVKDEFGNTPIHYLAYNGHFAPLKKIFAMSDGQYQYLNDNSETPLMYALKTTDLNLTSFFVLIKNTSLEQMKIRNYEWQNVMHLICLYQHADAFEELLQNPTYSSLVRELLIQPDLYGYTPIDYILKSKNEDMLSILNDYDLMPSNANDRALELSSENNNDLSQANLNQKLMKYIRLKGGDANRVVDENGACNGWSFLYQVYCSDNREDEFYEILNTIAEWDETSASLALPLPDSLKDKYFSRGKESPISAKEDLFEQTINDVIFFHMNTAASSALELGWGQKDREKQYDLLRDELAGRQLKSLFKHDRLKLTVGQLAEMLRFFSRLKGLSIDVGGSEHATSLYITPEGLFKYFDPNFSSKVQVFRTADELAKHIFQFKYKALGKTDQNDLMLINFHGYQFQNKLDTTLEKKSHTLKPLPNLAESENLFNQLIYAVMENDIDKVKALLETNTDNLLDQRDAHGYTPLMRAAQLGYQDIFMVLLQKGAILDVQNNLGETALMLAIKYGHSSIAKKLIDKKSDLKLQSLEKDTAFIYAAKYGRLDMLEILLKEEANVDLNSCNIFKDTPLMLAAKYGHAKIARKLLELGANPDLVNTENETAAMFAAKNRSREIIDLFLQGEKGEACLRLAAKVGNVVVVKALLDMGVLPNAKDGDGFTPLMNAVCFGQKVRDLLLERLDVAAINAGDNDNNTALHCAAGIGDINSVKKLLEAGADPSIQNIDGQTAVDVARLLGNQEIALLLSNHMAALAPTPPRPLF